MKKLLLIAIMLIPQLLSAQMTEDEIYGDNYDTGKGYEYEYNIENEDAKLIAAKPKHIQMCMDKFANQQRNRASLEPTRDGATFKFRF